LSLASGSWHFEGSWYFAVWRVKQSRKSSWMIFLNIGNHSAIDSVISQKTEL
jgi:hypothetical protein